MTTFESFDRLSDPDLLSAVRAAAQRERTSTAELVALLAHVDSRRLYLGQGYSSLFTYCTQALHLSEHAAYGRIEAARAAKRFPMLLDLLANGALNLTTVTLLAPHLTAENHAGVLDEARHKNKRDVEHIVARLRPQADAPSTVRKLPVAPVARPSADENHGTGVQPPATPAPVPAHRPASGPSSIVAPTAPERYKVQFTASRQTFDKLRRLQDLLRHSIPDGDVATIVDRALTLLLADVEKAKLARTERPRTAGTVVSGSRHIPAAVRREVWSRDGGQCAFVGADGRCAERGFLEFHHVEPHAVGGPPSVDNVQLRCRVHNLHEAEVYFGRRWPLLAREEGVRYVC